MSGASRNPSNYFRAKSIFRQPPPPTRIQNVNPILSAAALGFAKRLFMPGPVPKDHRGALHTCVLGPLAEELAFREAPERAGVPAPLASAAFAMAHFVGEKNVPTGNAAVFRFADVFTGGMLYTSAYRQMGYLGAVAAHAAHNWFCDLGRGGFLPVPQGSHSLRMPFIRPERKKLRK